MIFFEPAQALKAEERVLITYNTFQQPCTKNKASDVESVILKLPFVYFLFGLSQGEFILNWSMQFLLL